ncbi:MAG: hypothetical protein LBJ12_01650 [Oscillospiraceae bacterium]|nr:hypothetical protein [Oscillospiraceae bacterium]
MKKHDTLSAAVKVVAAIALIAGAAAGVYFFISKLITKKKAKDKDADFCSCVCFDDGCEDVDDDATDEAEDSDEAE